FNARRGAIAIVSIKKVRAETDPDAQVEPAIPVKVGPGGRGARSGVVVEIARDGPDESAVPLVPVEHAVGRRREKTAPADPAVDGQQVQPAVVVVVRPD